MSKIPFGKFKGEDIPDVPDSYLRWLEGQDWFDDEYPTLMEEVSLELQRRAHYDDHIN